MITLQGLCRSAGYSFPTNKKNYCGPENAFSFFREFVKKPAPSDKEKISALIRGFPILYSYYDFVAQKAAVDSLDERVIDYYWLGSDLVLFSEVEAKNFVKNNLHNQGLSAKRVEQVCSNISGDTRLDHAFHVLNVNFVTNKVERTIENFSNCLVLPARVIENRSDGLACSCLRLSEDKKSLVEREMVLQNPFGLDLNAGDFVSVHWQNAIEKVSKSLAKSIENRVLQSIT